MKVKCPKCEHDFEIPKLKCTRCGHNWVRRRDKLPKVCPRCKSPYWDKERKR